ncbi:MAG: alpha-amylase family glycosyl hydrolase [Polyangiaceae bacterium]
MRLSRALAVVVLSAGCAARPPAPPPMSAATAGEDPWLRQVIYLALTDRFANGDPGNDRLAPPDCFDPGNPRLFHGGDLAGLRAHIPYLKDLGASVVWLTPLYAQVPLRDGSCGYHGYWADFVDPDDGALEAKLGTWDEVAGLRAALHAAGMRIVIDMVVNHSGRGARIVAQHPNWFHDEATCASRGDPIIECPLHGLPDFAEEDPVVADYLTALSVRWVERVRPDGIRLDTAKHMPASYLARSFVPGVRGARREGASDLFLIAEVFDTDSFARFVPVLDAGFDSAFHFPLHRALVETFAKGGPVDAVADIVLSTRSALGAARALSLVTFLDNHDVPRFMTAAPRGLSSGELSRRYAVALTALFTLPGIPQIYQGDELGMVGVYPDNRRDMPEWAFRADGRAGVHDGTIGDPQATWALVKRLASLRRDTPALFRGDYRELARRGPGVSDVLAFLRRTPEGSALVVLGNNDAEEALTIPMNPADGWRDGTVLHEQLGAGAPSAVAIAGQAVAIRLPAHTAAVYLGESRP